MKMKRIASLLLLLSVVYFVQCNNNPVDPEPGPGPGPNPGGKSSVFLNILVPKSNVSTYAGIDATAYENHIDTLYVDLYQGQGSASILINQSKFYGNALQVMMNTNDSIVTVGYEVDNITTGTLHAEVFANSRTSRILSNPDSVPLPKGNAATSFFMSGKIDQINYDAGSGTYKAEIPLQRNVAKVRVNIAKHSVILPADLEIDYDNIKITTLNIANQTALFGPTPDVTNTYISTDERTGAFLHRSPSFNTTTGGQIDSFYVYENCRSSFSDANTTRIKIEIPTISPTTGSKNDTYTYSLYTVNDGYNLKRNYIYTLDIKVRGQSLEPVITTNIQPWNDVNIDASVHGTYLTMDKSEVTFDSNGEMMVNFCTDAQAVYFNFEDFNEANIANGAEIGTHILYPIGVENANPNLAPSDFKDGQILLDKQHCGTFGFRINLEEYPEFPAVNFSGRICIKAGNIVKCLSFPGIRTYDAHFIVGDSIFDWNEKFISATVSTENNDPWLRVSENRLYKSAEMLNVYGPNATPKVLYLHLDENLTGSARTGSVTVITEGGAEKTLHISQLPAIPVGRFGYNTNNATDSSIYSTLLYTEQLYEFNTMIPYKGVDDDVIPTSNFIYNGWGTTKNVYEPSNYSNNFNYMSASYIAMNYCAYKNRGSNTDGSLSDGDIKWYLPAQAQLMGMWLSYSSYKGLSTSNFYKIENSSRKDADIYWSATANALYKKEAQYVNFLYGNVGHYYKNIDKRYWTRCVRNGSATTSMVTTSAEGYPVIDFANGIPTNSYTSVSKGSGTGDENSINNLTLYRRLSVALTDVSTSGSNWTDAISACTAHDPEPGTSAGRWRVPTQRELQAIWILQSEMKKSVSAFDLLSNNYYWSATESATSLNGANYTNAWMVYGGRENPGDAGNTPHSIKTLNTPFVRCVREE